MLILNAAARRAICSAQPERMRAIRCQCLPGDLLRHKGLSITRNIVSQRDNKADLCAGQQGESRATPHQNLPVTPKMISRPGIELPHDPLAQARLPMQGV
jgi:hypothetical protein